MLRYQFLPAVLLCLFFTGIHAEEGKVRAEDSPVFGRTYSEKMSEVMDFIVRTSAYIAEKKSETGYKKPLRPPRVFIITRTYFTAHQDEICRGLVTVEEKDICANNLYGWTDDQLDIYLFHPDDALRTKNFPRVDNFPIAEWMDALLVHETTHYMQMFGTGLVPSALPCEQERKWEQEASDFAGWWLRSRQNQGAQRLVVIMQDHRMGGATCHP